jgi:hypothetical protein
MDIENTIMKALFSSLRKRNINNGVRMTIRYDNATIPMNGYLILLLAEALCNLPYAR